MVDDRSTLVIVIIVLDCARARSLTGLTSNRFGHHRIHCLPSGGGGVGLVVSGVYRFFIRSLIQIAVARVPSSN